MATKSADVSKQSPATTPTESTKKANGVDASKFEGAGLSFRGKLIGIEDVPESRGEKMCVVSMAKLKAVVVAMKEHKRPITINVSMEGIRVQDDKSEEILYTHLVHRVSFIFRDTTDSRAFGYIYRREDGMHQFFAIKTDKGADAVVISLRDLFEAVHSKKKKEGDETVDAAATTTPSITALNKVDENKNVQPVEQLEHYKNPPLSDDLFTLEEPKATEQPSQVQPSNAWLLNTFGPSGSPQGPGQPNYQLGGAPVVMTHPGFFPPQGQMTSQMHQQQMFYAQTGPQQAVSWPQASTPQQHPMFANGYPSNPGAPGGVPATQPAGVFPGRPAPPRPVQGAFPGPQPDAFSSAQTGVAWPDTSLHGDPFKHDSFFGASSTPAGALNPNAVGIIPVQGTSTSLFDTSSSMSIQASTSVFGTASDSSGSTLNEGFYSTPMKPVAVQSGPQKHDPFADLAALKISPAPQPSGKKISKEDFIKDPPKPTLSDLTQLQQQQGNSNQDPFGNATSNPFAATSADDPFA